MDDLILDLDFSEVNSAKLGQGISYPPRDYYDPTVKQYKLFADEGTTQKKLYVYLETKLGIISDNFRLGVKADMERLAGHLISIGIAPGKVLGSKGNVPFHKFVGRKAYVFYTPPLLDPSGAKVEGSYPRTKYFTKEEWVEAKGSTNIRHEENTDNGSAANSATDSVPESKPTTTAAATPAAGNDEDWLS